MDENSNVERELHLKVLTLGEARVGKTSIIKKLSKDDFSAYTTATVGINKEEVTLTYDDKRVTLSIYDTAGQERYSSICRQFFQKANGVILVYDITIESSFQRITKWIDEINSSADFNTIGCVLLGNKNDKYFERKVSLEDGKNFAENLGIPFFETSAKTGYGLKESLAELCRQCEKKNLSDSIERKSTILSREAKVNGSCCH